MTPNDFHFHSNLGLVIIGRNEGVRLKSCLLSVIDHASRVVYVDSGSTDGSVDLARALGTNVVNLDLSKPFTAARARNAGLSALRSLFPDIEFVQFVDGDCQISEKWLVASVDFLRQNPECAMVCGRLREKFPEHSIYNRLCDIEWDGPIGEIRACGGVAMGRVDAIQLVDGFRETLIAGEEPELCYRLRLQGWKIYRISGEMALHDAAMTRFSQWWRRAMRGGYAFAEGSWLHGSEAEHYWVRETISALAWGIGIPILVWIASLWISMICLLLLTVYPLQVLRLSSVAGGWKRAIFLVVGKFPESIGILKFYASSFRRTQQPIIEYK